MQHIPLTQGQFAMVDDDDYDYLTTLKWAAHKVRWRKTVYGYRAVYSCCCPFSKKYCAIYMHRLIMRCPKDKVVDHIDHNQLNNRKSNLRICTQAENVANTTSRRGTSSQYKGVSWFKPNQIWIAYITVKQKKIHLGCFRDEQEAAKTYDAAAVKHFKEFAYTNFR